jgi:long-chain acyl-CoA synthetase
MNVAEWLYRSGVGHGPKTAIWHGDAVFADYARFAQMAAQCAHWLQQNGIGPAEPVAVFLPNCPEYLPILYGIWWSGAAAIPINAKLHPKEVEWILENSDAHVAIVGQELMGDMNAPDCQMVVSGTDEFGQIFTGPAMLRPVYRTNDDLAWLFYTSGTTGRPKGVHITHGMLGAMTLAYFADVDQVEGDDNTIYAAPMSHAAGIYNFMHVLKGSGHIVPESGGFDPAEIFDIAEKFGRCHLFAAPTMVHRMTSAAKASGSTGKGLRTVIYAGGPMYNADIIEAVDHFGPIFAQVYGQGECPMSITALSRHDVADRTHPRWRERLASVGLAQSVVDVRIGDADGQEMPRGSVGEIMVRGQTVMPGYWRNPEATAKTIIDGWLLTGDMGHMDDDGYVTMVDRSKDMIISGGSNIYPREVEEVLLTHPDVSETSVIGAPDPEWGEVVVAFIVGDKPIDPAELDALCLAQIARFKRPKRYIQIKNLPKNNYGKVLKTELRQQV